MEIVEFLRARLDEDEAGAQAATWGPWAASGRWIWAQGRPDAVFGVDGDPADVEYIARHDPARALREVEAKRRIVEDWEGHEERTAWALANDLSPAHPDERRTAVWAVLRHLAAVWSDHPDYRLEWKP